MLELSPMRRKQDEKQKPIPITASFTVKRSCELLEFLLSKYNGKLSRNSVKKLLSEHKVLVNGAVTTQYNFPLAKDDEVKIAKSSVKSAPNPAKSKSRPASTPALKPYIIYEDDDFLAINKPAGLLSVQSDKERHCAYTMAVEYLKETSPSARPYILHRIDKETSGVLVFAKNIKLHSMLKTHWNDVVTMREYYAVVSGTPEEPSGHLVHYLKENDLHMVYVSKDHRGRKAVTDYETVKSSGTCSLLRVVISTGRKNQIRAQLNEIGHPVLGDDKFHYVESPIGRLCLHASILEFLHPITKKPMRFHAPVPTEFKTLVGKNR